MACVLFVLLLPLQPCDVDVGPLLCSEMGGQAMWPNMEHGGQKDHPCLAACCSQFLRFSSLGFWACL